MRLVTAANAAALAVALGAAAALAPHATPPVRTGLVGSASKKVALPDGGYAIADATGQLVPLRPYRRIVSTSILTDRLLVAMCEPDRILAFSTTGASSSPWAYQYAGKPTAEGLGALEPLLALKPDLVLMNSFGAPERARKLRAAGVAAFDLGEMRGLATLGPTVEAVAELVGHPERGAELITALRLRLANVAARLDRPRKRAVYLVVHGPILFGGTRGTSYHDVLSAAGLDDVAAAQFSGWPKYSSEQVLAMQPEIVVTKSGMGALVCMYPGLARLAACTSPGSVLELPSALIDEPGPAMLDAAERLFSMAYPHLREQSESLERNE